KANATMTSIVGEFPPGRAIDLGCGEGGDVLWLAEQGWQAHGLDISTVAIDRARSEAVARGLERATFTAADLSTWRPEPDSVELVTAAFFQSHVALDRIEILRRAATAIRPGGHLVVISHAQPPSWSSAHQHEGPQLVSARDDAAELALPSDAWVVEAADERSRPAVGHDGEPSELIDAVLVLRRR
ncbi:MAG TPA: class I SAM-dependent methyltransferase, partial [Candidatus Brachybacterium merdavium]|nr:class I SAM-dependent methyltransferase [Candidatus Brachybacterium merdavium]